MAASCAYGWSCGPRVHSHRDVPHAPREPRGVGLLLELRRDDALLAEPVEPVHRARLGLQLLEHRRQAPAERGVALLALIRVRVRRARGCASPRGGSSRGAPARPSRSTPWPTPRRSSDSRAACGGSRGCRGSLPMLRHRDGAAASLALDLAPVGEALARGRAHGVPVVARVEDDLDEVRQVEGHLARRVGRADERRERLLHRRPRAASSFACQASEPVLMRAKVQVETAPSGCTARSAPRRGATRRYHFEFCAFIFDHASSAGPQSLVVKLCAAAQRGTPSAPLSPGSVTSAAAAWSSAATALHRLGVRVGVGHADELSRSFSGRRRNGRRRTVFASGRFCERGAEVRPRSAARPGTRRTAAFAPPGMAEHAGSFSVFARDALGPPVAAEEALARDVVGRHARRERPRRPSSSRRVSSMTWPRRACAGRTSCRRSCSREDPCRAASAPLVEVLPRRAGAARSRPRRWPAGTA